MRLPDAFWAALRRVGGSSSVYGSNGSSSSVYGSNGRSGSGCARGRGRASLTLSCVADERQAASDAEMMEGDWSSSSSAGQTAGDRGLTGGERREGGGDGEGWGAGAGDSASRSSSTAAASSGGSGGGAAAGGALGSVAAVAAAPGTAVAPAVARRTLTGADVLRRINLAAPSSCVLHWGLPTRPDLSALQTPKLRLAIPSRGCVPASLPGPSCLTLEIDLLHEFQGSGAAPAAASAGAAVGGTSGKWFSGLLFPPVEVMRGITRKLPAGGYVARRIAVARGPMA